MQIFNYATATGVYPDGITWGSASDLVPAGTVANGAWRDFEGYFRLPSIQRFSQSDGIYFRLSGYFGETANTYLIYDDASVYGPVLKPGLSTW